MTNVLAEAYVAGVSTRRVEHLVEALGIDGISKSQVSEIAKSLDAVVDDFRNRSLAGREYPFVWLDALTIKTREGGRVVNVAAVTATGATTDGQREVPGLGTFTSEDEAAWVGLFRCLVERELAGVKLVMLTTGCNLDGITGRDLTPGQGR